MDQDLEQIRIVYAEDPVPDQRSMATLRDQMAVAMAQEISEATSKPTKWRFKRFAGRRWTWAMPVAVASAVLLVVLLLPRAGQTDLGMQVASYRENQLHAQPHLLDKMLSFSYLPKGFSLTSDSRSNKLTEPAEFDRTIVFTTGAETLSISVSQSAAFDTPFAPLGTVSNTSVTPTIIRGHRGEILTSTPAANTPPGGFRQPCGPPQPANTSVNALTHIALIWNERPGVQFTVAGVDLSLDQLIRVADGIVYHHDVDACLTDGRVTSTRGGCSAGTVSSPSADYLSIPTGGTEIASGTVNSIPWVFSAAVAPDNTNTWYLLEYRGQLAGGSCASGTGASSQLDVATALDGQRFATGAVPDLVTSVTATSAHGNGVTQSVLPRRLHGLAFFALSLGTFHGVCDDLCRGEVTFAFYHGATKVATLTVPGDLSLASFPIPARDGRAP